MGFQLRPYQSEVKTAAQTMWANGTKNVLVVLPTGAGKTVVLADIVSNNQGASCCIAHRQELVAQISMALARDGVYHRIIGPAAVVKLCVRAHTEELGETFYNPNAACAVAGVDTLVKRYDSLKPWLQTVTLWVQDEAHHVLKDNKWGVAAGMFPYARGLGVTATPMRADGKGLARDYDGLFDDMIVGPDMRNLIDAGFLTDYRIFAPLTDINLDDVTVSAKTGDYTKPKLTNAVRESKIVGDVVEHYLKIANGKQGVTFATDVQTSEDIAEKFRSAGVPAEAVSAKTPAPERAAIIRKFKNRELRQLINCDLFGEGFDLPAIEVVSMARPTQSYGLYVQQFGRALRLLPGKVEAIIIDHVGNVVLHGLPDARRNWSLARREGNGKAKKKDPDEIPVRACPECTSVYERVEPYCPYCGHIPVPEQRNGPEFVDGDLTELDAETLARMRGDVADVAKDKEVLRAELAAKFVPVIGQLSMVKKHVARQEAHADLLHEIAMWAGHEKAKGRGDKERYKRFFHRFGIDVLTAQSLKTKEAVELTERVKAHYETM